MLRTFSLLSVLAALAVCLVFAVSCGNASTADAAPRAHVPDSNRHELSLMQADGTETKMEVIGWSHEVISPRDAASGLPTGKRQHKPILIRKRIDAATPLIAQALTNNEVYTMGTLTSYRTGPAGEEIYRVVELTTPWIAEWGGAGDTDDGGDHEDREEVSFYYNKIVWTWSSQGGSTTAQDDWDAGR